MIEQLNGTYTLIDGTTEIDIAYSATPIGVTLDSRVRITGDGEERTEDLEEAIPCWHTLGDIRDRIHRGYYERQ